MKIHVPWRIKSALKTLLAPVKPRSLTGDLRCPVCDADNPGFAPLRSYYDDMLDRHGYIHSIYLSETINRREYTCRRCGATDRERLYALYFKGFVNQGGELRNILDIAPAAPLAAFLKRSGATGYRSADLMKANVDDRVDIQNMSIYKSEQFRIFICSHVLEHVRDDRAAMGELYRVLVPGGWGICMVPINLGLVETYEDANIVDEAGRWKHFGQDDHVRLYSKADFVARLESVGFRVEQQGAPQFGIETFRRHAIHPRSVLYIAHKDAR